MKYCLTQVTVLLLSGLAFSQITRPSHDRSKEKKVGSKECIVAQYCTEQNAVNALVSELATSYEDARQFVSKFNKEDSINSCSCHPSCGYFGICCEDAESRTAVKLTPLAKRLTEDPAAYVCKSIKGSDLLVVSSCPPESNADFSQRCSEDFEDGRYEIHVTSRLTQLTYKNVYCGLCNGEKMTDLKFWTWNFDCLTLSLPQSDVVHADLIQRIIASNCKLDVTLPVVPSSNETISHKIGVYMDSLDYCSNKPTSSCPSNTDTTLRRQCEEGPNAFVMTNSNVLYKNSFCLKCNEPNINITQALCESCERENCSHEYQPKGLSASFGVLVKSVQSDEGNKCGDNDEKCKKLMELFPKCGNGEFVNIKTGRCEAICPPRSYFQNGECIFVDFSTECGKHFSRDAFTNLPIENSTHTLIGKTFMIGGAGDTQCYNCTYLASSGNTTAVRINSDGTATFNGKRIPSHLVYKSSNSHWFVCADELDIVNEVLSCFLLGLSLFCLILYFCAFFLMKRLRNVPGRIVVGNMTCLFIAYILFLSRLALKADTIECTVFAVLIHYFLLASFVFNIIYASFIVHSLELIDFESSVSNWTAVKMWALGLLLPFVVIIPALVLDSTPENIYKPQYGGMECFIMNDYGRYIFFIGPIGLLLLVALILYTVILVKFVQIARATSQVRSNHKEKVAIAVKLVIVLGFTWIFAVAAATSQQPVLVTIFILTCTLQGFLSFIVFICNKATVKDLKKFLDISGHKDIEMSTSSSTKHTLSTDLNKRLLIKNDSCSQYSTNNN